MVSDLICHPHGVITKRISLEGEDNVCTSIIVASELRFGAHRRSSKQLTRQLDLVLSTIQVMPFEAPADRLYGKLRVYLEERGTPIGPYDMLIAAQALALDCTIVTRNVREFSRLPELKVDDWQN